MLEAGSALTEIVTTLVIPEVTPIIVTVVVADTLTDCATKLTESADNVLLVALLENLTIFVFSIVNVYCSVGAPVVDGFYITII